MESPETNDAPLSEGDVTQADKLDDKVEEGEGLPDPAEQTGTAEGEDSGTPEDPGADAAAEAAAGGPDED